MSVCAKFQLSSTEWIEEELQITTSTGGWVGGLSETGNKAISASIEIEVELSWGKAELGNKMGKAV